MTTYEWYMRLHKPAWAPPIWLFGTMWTPLYIIIAVTYGTIFYKVFTKELPGIVAVPFALNLLFNLIFTPIQLGLKNNWLASLDIFFLVGSLIWAIWLIWHTSPELRWITYANIPYLLWGSFATALQLSITYLNR